MGRTESSFSRNLLGGFLAQFGNSHLRVHSVLGGDQVVPDVADVFLMGLSGEGQAPGRSISQRLTAATDELQKLEKLVVSGDCAPRVLNDFRGAVDSIRQTAWAVQQWSELQQQQRDPYSVLGILQEERVRRAAQLTRDLTLDLDSLELGLDTAGLAELFRAIEGLYGRLMPLFRKNVI